jgi:hypothetical protein
MGGDCLYIALGLYMYMTSLLHQLIADDKSTSLKNNNIVGARTKLLLLLLPSAIVEIDERRRKNNTRQIFIFFFFFERRRRRNYSIYYIYYILYIYCLLMGVRLFHGRTNSSYSNVSGPAEILINKTPSQKNFYNIISESRESTENDFHI